jgi:hypothetical protein
LVILTSLPDSTEWLWVSSPPSLMAFRRRCPQFIEWFRIQLGWVTVG